MLLLTHDPFSGCTELQHEEWYHGEALPLIQLRISQLLHTESLDICFHFVLMISVCRRKPQCSARAPLHSSGFFLQSNLCF